jgi:hypothetical protein
MIKFDMDPPFPLDEVRFLYCARFYANFTPRRLSEIGLTESKMQFPYQEGRLEVSNVGSSHF